MSGGAASGGHTPASCRKADAERLPLFGAHEGSPTGMGTLKHRAGGSLGDVAAGAFDDAERGGAGGGAPAPAGLAGVAPAVLLCVAVASMGAFSFGYALGVVNGPLEVLASQLGFGGDAFRQGLVRAGALALALAQCRLPALAAAPAARLRPAGHSRSVNTVCFVSLTLLPPSSPAPSCPPRSSAACWRAPRWAAWRGRAWRIRWAAAPPFCWTRCRWWRARC